MAEPPTAVLQAIRAVAARRAARDAPATGAAGADDTRTTNEQTVGTPVVTVGSTAAVRSTMTCSSDLPEPLRRQQLWIARRAQAAQAASVPRTRQVYEVFAKQVDACMALDRAILSERRRDLKLFSIETRGMRAEETSRRFLVADMHSFWQQYRRALPEHRHFYEICREDTPCHLYLDIEYRRAPEAPSRPGLNAHHDGDAGVAAVLFALAVGFQQEYGIRIGVEDVLHLESSTSQKFSRHVLISCPGGELFRDNLHAGAFVRRCVAALRQQTDDASVPDDFRAAMLSAWADVQTSGGAEQDKGEKECIVDLGVYTRNRAMRMYLSCKLGKTTPLMPAASNAFRLLNAPLDRSTADAGDGAHLTMPYWLQAAQAPSVESSSASPSCAQLVRLGTGPSDVPVRIGSAEWEHALWQASLITSAYAPLWIEALCLTDTVGDATKRARLADRGITDGLSTETSAETVLLPAMYDRWNEHSKYRPTNHPSFGCRLLYFCNSGEHDAGITNTLDTQVISSPACATAPVTDTQSPADASVRASGTDGQCGAAQPRLRFVNGGSAKPPFPALAAYVCSLASGPLPSATGAAPSHREDDMATRPRTAFVRAWSALVDDADHCEKAYATIAESGSVGGPPSYRNVIYEIGGSRWCNRIARHHKSNHVQWVVELDTGIAYQRCWDVDCRSQRYRSDAVPLPSHVLPENAPARLLARDNSLPASTRASQTQPHQSDYDAAWLSTLDTAAVDEIFAQAESSA